MPTLPKTRSLLRSWLLLALGAVSCVGTPTPEPPDLLPRPEIIVVRETSAPEVAVDNVLAPIEFTAPPGAVGGDADVWIVNLDGADSPPITTRANANGSFAATITGAHAGDRIRVVARDGDRHSLPLDLAVVPSPPPLGPKLVNQAPDLLTCLQISPAEDVTVVARTSAVTRHIVVDNGCGEDVSIDAALRFGDQGIQLASPPTRVPADAQIELEVTFAGRGSSNVRADIVLLELSTGTLRGRRGVGVWSVAR